MKALRNYRIKFHCQLGAIGMLAVVGLIAICGEPVDDSRWLVTFAMQVMVWAASWGIAAMLYHLWGLNRVVNMLNRLERHRK